MHRSTETQACRLSSLRVCQWDCWQRTPAGGIQGAACTGALWYWRQVSAASCPESAHGVILHAEYKANKKEKQVEKKKRKLMTRWRCLNKILGGKCMLELNTSRCFLIKTYGYIYL